MPADRLLDLVCVSYLADAQVLRVAAYPSANGGAVVDHITTSVAGDGPLTAIAAGGLGLRAGLGANAVGGDPPGERILAWLDAPPLPHPLRAPPAGPNPPPA